MPDNSGPQCACGCGQRLPFGSSREYKRGHKSNPPGASADVFGQVGGGVNPSTTAFATAEEWQRVEPEWTEEELAAIPEGLRDAMDSTPRDAPPADEPPKVKAPKGSYKPTAKVIRDVEGKLAFWFGMGTTMLSPLDPICFGAAADNSAEIVKALTPIMCQSPEVVAWLTKTGNFALWAALAQALWPVIQAMIAHHVMHSVGKQARDGSQNGHANGHVSQDMYKAA